MVARLKAKFIPRDYEMELFQKLEKMKQKDMSVKEYTEEFYKMVIRSGHHQMDRENMAKYING